MTLLDRYIMRRFLTNFVILFLLIYLLATAIDLILQLDEFMQAVEEIAGEDAGFIKTMTTLASLVVNFHGPRAFQLFAYLLGITCVGAMGFTLSQMYRHRELVAILASGVSLYRVVWPIVVAAFVLNGLHIINSNIILPHFAPALIRGHNDLQHGSIAAFEVPLTEDGHGSLLHAPAYHQDSQTLEHPTFLERDEHGRTVRHTSALSAQWNEAEQAWVLNEGVHYNRTTPGDAPNAAEAPPPREAATTIETDLTPEALVVRRYAQFAQMLSPGQIEALLQSPGAVDAAALARIKYSRYAVVFTNLLMLLMTIPFFLLREPTNLLRQSIMCAVVALGAMLGAFIGMEMSLPGIPPVAGVFLPVIVLIPLTIFSASFVRT